MNKDHKQIKWLPVLPEWEAIDQKMFAEVLKIESGKKESEVKK